MLIFLHFCFNLFFDSVSHNSWTTLRLFVVNVCPSAMKPSNKMCRFRIHYTPAVNLCFLSVNDDAVGLLTASAPSSDTTTTLYLS